MILIGLVDTLSHNENPQRESAMRAQTMQFRATRLILLAVGMILAGCADKPLVPEKFPPVSFTNQKAYVFNVARVEIVPKFTSSSNPPHIEFDMPVSPENALKRWVEGQARPES